MSKNSYYLPAPYEIKKHWKDYGEGCFACGSLGSLERCHIVSRMDGGADTVENLHLLCRACHKASELLAGDEYFSWLENRALEDSLSQLANYPTVSLSVVLKDHPSKDEVMSLIGTAILTSPASLSASERTKQGMEKAREAGARIGRPPVGWRIVNGEWEGTERLSLVKKAHKLRCKGYSLMEIADVFNSEGLPTGSGRGSWWPTAIKRLLDSPTDSPSRS